MATMYVKSQPSKASFIPLLMGVTQKNITFIVDTSEAISAMLGAVKDLLIQTLLAKASLRDSLFNIVSCSYKVTKWRNLSVVCAPDTVFEVLGWIHSLDTCPGSDLLTALEAAFSDPHCQAAHWLTSVLPDRPEHFLRGLSTMTLCPVHVFFLSHNSQLESRTLDFLQCLTSATGGSCHLLLLGLNGSIDKVSMLYAVDSAITSLRGSEESCCGLGRPLALAMHSVPISAHRFQHGNPFAPIITCGSESTTGLSQLYPGCRVLASRETDGLYYLGTIREQILNHRGVFLVEFDRQYPKDSPDSTSPFQLVCPPDMVHHTHAHIHSLVPGDTVLAPWGPELWKYGPGRVLTGSEPRDPFRGVIGSGLRVLFWNGIEATVPPDLALWIPASQHEHIVRELQRFLKTQCIHTTTHCAPAVLRGCCVCSMSCCHSASQCHSSVMPLKTLCLPTTHHFLTQEQSQREQLMRKVDLKLQELHTSAATPTRPLLSAFSDGEDDKDEEGDRGYPGLELVSQAVNTDLSFLGPTRAEPQSRPSWRYWRSSPTEPHHKKPEKLAMGSILPVSIGSPELQMRRINQSSVFQKIPGSAGRKATIQEIFSITKPKLHQTAGHYMLEAGKTMQE
ncbi:uncharacterized protein C11orf16 homolog [Clupea harengus]|uniref:Uncharacterized protein C11orf16 homolog n=1 Tax=Clupea harengus TaxID=7950 RepID=A0A8M1KHZ3_CLUHA|nr:uncharacterized protein C11orf16 homolog [Clupea harengus]